MLASRRVENRQCRGKTCQIKKVSLCAIQIFCAGSLHGGIELSNGQGAATAPAVDERAHPIGIDIRLHGIYRSGSL